MLTSSGAGVPPCPGSVAATRCRSASFGSAISSSYCMAVHMPPGRHRTVCAASGDPDSRRSQCALRTSTLCLGVRHYSATSRRAKTALRGPPLQVVQRVRDRPVDAHLEVQVRAEAQAGAAADADDLTLADALAERHLEGGLVGVARGERARVRDA